MFSGACREVTLRYMRQTICRPFPTHESVFFKIWNAVYKRLSDRKIDAMMQVKSYDF